MESLKWPPVGRMKQRGRELDMLVPSTMVELFILLHM